MQGLRELGLGVDRFPAFIGYDDSDVVRDGRSAAEQCPRSFL